MAQKQREKKRKVTKKLTWLLTMWKKRVAWYSTRFKSSYRVRQNLVHKHPARGGGEGSIPTNGVPRASGSNKMLPTPRMKSSTLTQAVPKKSDTPSKGGPQPAMKISPWDPKTPYLQALKRAPGRKRYRVYLEQRKQHGKAPAFYLDCAHFFAKKRRSRLSLRILSNLAELELENPALLRVLAARLKQRREFDLSIGLYEKVLSLRPEEPQSYRDLALVLELRGDKRRGARLRREDYSRALSLLAKVVMGNWARFKEIELIALTELNTIWPKAQRVGITTPPVDRRLLKHLTMDVRIVMTWDADLTDMDLHILEPSGEEAYYRYKRTVIGGLVSRDFTRGYGPEVYLLRRAMRGTYKIKANYYSSRAVKLAGAVTLQVDVYTNYGRPNQRRRSLTLRLKESKENFFVGSIHF